MEHKKNLFLSEFVCVHCSVACFLLSECAACAVILGAYYIYSKWWAAMANTPPPPPLRLLSPQSASVCAQFSAARAADKHTAGCDGLHFRSFAWHGRLSGTNSDSVCTSEWDSLPGRCEEHRGMCFGRAVFTIGIPRQKLGSQRACWSHSPASTHPQSSDKWLFMLIANNLTWLRISILLFGQIYR
jgi:hypothetical protein